MSFFRKIYISNKPLILTNDAAAYIKDHIKASGYLHLAGAFPRQFRLALDHLKRPRTLGAIIEDMSPESLLEEIHKIYTPIQAAGGVVRNENGAVLLIYRRGKWDLPKGKLDAGEDLDYCAIREVVEETGIVNVSIDKKICETYHTYSQKGQNLLKETSWYTMHGNSKDKLAPQASEGIVEARWFAPSDVATITFKTYDAVLEVLMAAGVGW